MSTMQPNTLMRTHVLSCLPTSRHLSLVCCAGSNGYGALKEMMDDGEVGRTLLLESDDLRDVENASDACCLIYTFDTMYGSEYHALFPKDDVHSLPLYKDHIPPTVSHIHVYWDMESCHSNLLENCDTLKTIELKSLRGGGGGWVAWQVGAAFLAGCSGLEAIDLSCVSGVTEVCDYFLGRCSGLTHIDLSPLSQVTVVYEAFLSNCSGLKSIDLTPLSLVEVVFEGFLEGCSGLTEIDLNPLSQVGVIGWSFLEGCTGLKVIDMSSLTNLTELPDDFVENCGPNMRLILPTQLAV